MIRVQDRKKNTQELVFTYYITEGKVTQEERKQVQKPVQEKAVENTISE